MRRARAGQSLTDYAVAIGVVAAMMATMQTFLQRYVQAKVKHSADGVLAISWEDAPPNPYDPADTRSRNPNDWGRLTQRKGVDRRDAGSGIGGGPIVADVTSTNHGILKEENRGGRWVAFEHSITADTPPNQQLFFKGERHLLGAVAAKDGRWFRTPKQKAREAKAAQQRKQRERELERRKKYEAERRAQTWEALKEQARQCYANKRKECLTGLTRRVMENPKKFQRFVKQWNRGRSKKDPFRLDPNDPSGAWEKIYGLNYEGAQAGWEGSEYAEPPDSWTKPNGLTDVEKLPYMGLLYYYYLPIQPASGGTAGSSGGTAGGGNNK